MKLLVSFSMLYCLSFAAIAQDATSFYNEGVKLKEQKKIADARDKFRQATELKTNYTEALYELGWCRNDLKDYTGALQALRKTMPAWNNVYKANFELGYAFEKLTNYDSATYYYQRCLEINPYNAGVYKQLGTIAYQKEDNTATLDYFAKYENYVKTAVTDYLYWYRKGFTQNAIKDYAGAKQSLLKALDLKTDYINIFLELGFASKNLKENDAAIDYYKQAMQDDPKNYIPYNGIGEVYRDNIKDMTESMNWYQKALAISPNERKACFGIGYCLNSLGRYTEAISYLKKAIEMENTYTAAYVELGYSYYMTSNNTDALSNLNKALDLNPKNENARYYKGLIYINQNDKTSAQKMVDELRQLNSKNTSTLQSKVDKM